MKNKILISIMFGILSLLVIACGTDATSGATPGQIGSLTKVNGTWSVLENSHTVLNQKTLEINMTVMNTSTKAIDFNPGDHFLTYDSNNQQLQGLAWGFNTAAGVYNPNDQKNPVSTVNEIAPNHQETGRLDFTIDPNNKQVYTVVFQDGSSKASWQVTA